MDRAIMRERPARSVRPLLPLLCRSFPSTAHPFLALPHFLLFSGQDPWRACTSQRSLSGPLPDGSKRCLARRSPLCSCYLFFASRPVSCSSTATAIAAQRSMTRRPSSSRWSTTIDSIARSISSFPQARAIAASLLSPLRAVCPLLLSASLHYSMYLDGLAERSALPSAASAAIRVPICSRSSSHLVTSAVPQPRARSDGPRRPRR